MFRPKLILLVFSSAIVPLVGCTGRSEPAGRPARVPVTVTVKYKGATVADASVTFFPKDPKGKPAAGTTDASGVAKLTTFFDTPGDGAVPGEYTVAIEKVEGGTDMGSAEETDEVEPEEGKEPAENVKDLLPAKYKDPQTSGLEATVPEGGKDFVFELTD